MRRVVGAAAVLMFSLLSMVPAAVVQSSDTGKATAQDPGTDPKQCLLEGGSWSKCLDSSTKTPVKSLESILKDVGQAGAGLGTLSAVQSVRKDLTHGT